ncbi:MAG: hypothetical protein COU40_00190 [Candidatus Moranbacteria bacterium CG10_big_fil_rev_8_21_14_0_10_35_21]|nr:MAG: hypothetical protein COU40_00190 [Candidatus Moranbacteria bacterium CG10_big_fil_rev_8_21_14_0_10_35_21]PJA88732.1 MAG: hypothetical protein CO139_01520 [Candidatus Moranbacteria bacterium CG_4_9_14_3_um_filter_36_9]
MIYYRKIIYTGLVFLLVLALLVGGIIFFYQKNQALEVIILDVGQGDAILISEGSNQILIDGGTSGKKLLEKLGEYIPFWDRQIEGIITTHPDQDHIGGLIDAFQTYKIKTIFKTEARSSSLVFSALEKAIEKEKPARNAFGKAEAGGMEIVEAKKGVKIKFPSGAEIDIQYPFASLNKLNEKDSNAGSVVAKLIFGENSFLFTGDLPSTQEAELIKNKVALKANILKVGHHGSKYSTSQEFLNEVKPEEAIISVGKNNRYGHPTPEVLERLKNIGAQIFRTDETGDIKYECSKPEARCVIVAN